ncbi:MAG: type VI secretion system tip protein VgrG [Deltaproteobacteria bacterium]|nr:type VI secretion system tip protein VgrG [Deltaproteobacteria bacterium]
MPQLDLSVASGDPLSVRRFSAKEAVSHLFAIEILARSEDPNIDLEGIVGKPASLRLRTGYKHAALGGARYWTGICSFVQQLQAVPPQPGEKALSSYFLRIVPRLWLLAQRRGCRIFQHVAIPDIIDKLLDEWSVERAWQIDRGKYPKLEYKVQYGESDYDFFSRLLEEAGIAFTFPDDDAQGSVLTLSDKLQQSPPRAGPPIHYVDNPNQAAEIEFVTSVTLSHEVRPGAHTIRDYDFRNPAFELFGEAPKDPALEGFYEQYNYLPGGMLVEGGKGGGTPTADDKGVARYDQKYGAGRAERALRGERLGRRAVSFETNTVDLWPGAVFSIENHPHAEVGQKLLLTDFSVQGEVAQDAEWKMAGRAVFAGEAYRPAPRTPKPRVHGVQSAMVVGPKGQEIHTDEFGRVRAQFPWDREGKADDNSSCWIRVSQGWSGTGFGMINLPRIGQEVLVGFLDGDPDQPIVVGRVFNAVEQVPYKLPDNRTVSGWKTNSSPGGGGYNEIKLEDKAGLELIYVQAQRNYDELVKNDETERTLRHHKKTVVGNQDLVVKQNKKELVELDSHLHVKGNRQQQIDKNTCLTVGADQQEKVGRNHALEAGEEIHLKAGARVVLEAGTRLTIKGPGGFVDIHAGGVDISGTLVRINSGGSAGAGLGAKPEKPADAEEAQPKDSSPP